MVVVCAAIHNNMNDTTWSMLLEWEQWHIQRGEVAGDVRTPTPYPFSPLCLGSSAVADGWLRAVQTPQLSKFMGRPFDLTPKARVKSWLGYGLPFDRHDW